MSLLPLTRSARPTAGHRWAVIADEAGGSALAPLGQEDVAIRVDARPDLARARRLRRSFDRVLWVRVDLVGESATATVAGVRRRRPLRVEVDGPTALGLLEAGVPAVVRRAGAEVA